MDEEINFVDYSGYTELGQLQYTASGTTIYEKYPEFASGAGPKFMFQRGEYTYTIQLSINGALKKMKFSITDEQEAVICSNIPLISGKVNLIGGVFEGDSELLYDSATRKLFYKE